MKITLLGDSIRQQYAQKVADLLGDEFEVWAPEDNCRFAKYTLRGLFDWANDMKGSEIVHWNNGHWDICRLFGDGTFTSEDEYVENMLRILDILQKRHAAVIFATTTPVLSSNIYNANEEIDRFNSRMVQLLQERGVIINDLNSLLKLDVGKYICEDAIHLTGEGIDLCADKVASCIKSVVKAISCSVKADEKQDDNTNKAGLGSPVIL